MSGSISCDQTRFQEKHPEAVLFSSTMVKLFR